MASYKIDIKKSAQKEIRNLPSKGLREKIVHIINELYSSPVPADAKKIKGSKNIYRIRQGTHRVVYVIYENELQIFVIRVRHRKESYQRL